ncbi:phospholipase D family protein [Candidatus Bathyarchaeota archaeon]|nr:phospholipase D family protein [Candidatus Bathyarchaeota archaeon]
MKVKVIIILLSFLTGILVGISLWNITPHPSHSITITFTKTIYQNATYANESIFSYEAYFSPNGKCEEKLIYWINKANQSIHIMIYSFTLDSIGDALINAYNKGVEVKIVMEKEQLTGYSEYYKLKKAGIEVKLDSNPALMHNKVAIIDGKIVITGSYNWSQNAETKNNENLLIIKSKGLAEVYELEFQKIWRQST